VPIPRTIKCCFGAQCLIRKGGIPSPQLLDDQNIVIFDGCQCVFHQNCYLRKK
jgi:hypothetical protein